MGKTAELLKYLLLCRHDAQLTSKSGNKSGQGTQVDSSSSAQPLPTQQFGVSLQFIKAHNNDQVIPPVVRQCVEFLSQPDGYFLR